GGRDAAPAPAGRVRSPRVPPGPSTRPPHVHSRSDGVRAADRVLAAPAPRHATRPPGGRRAGPDPSLDGAAAAQHVRVALTPRDLGPVEVLEDGLGDLPGAAQLVPDPRDGGLPVPLA